MPHTFFFSYARADQADRDDPLLRRFFADLRTEVAAQAGLEQDEVAFRDGDIRAGADWSRAIAEAVGSCRVFVPICSPHYFGRAFTGQEWQAFDQRLAAHEAATGARPEAIVPVWWLPLRREAPPVAAAIQHPFDSLPEDYRIRGLRHLIRLKGSRDAYYGVLVSLAERIIQAAEQPPAPLAIADLRTLPNAFERGAVEDLRPLDSTGAPAGGPRHVTFLVAAGGRDDMRVLRQDLDVYGEDWADWRPYHPGCPDRIAVRAQSEAAVQDLTSTLEVVSERLFETLHTARERNELVVLLVDPWAAQLAHYQPLLARFDGIRSPHAAVLVPWEPADAPPGGRGGALQAKLLAVLGEWADAGERVFRSDLGSIEVFVESLQQVLLAARARVVSRAEVRRRASETGPASRPSLAPFGG